MVKQGVNDVISTILEDFISPSRYEVYWTGGDSTFKYYVKSVSLPGLSTQQAEIFIDGYKVSVPMEVENKGTMDMTLYADNDVRGKLIGMIGTETEYSSIGITQIDDSSVIWKYEGCYVQSVGDVQLSSDGSGIPEYTVTVGYSHITGS